MATRTNPLVTAATLAGAAAIAVATPAIAPTLTLPTPHALSAAQVQLDTFADVLSIPAGEWTGLLFRTKTWGGVLGADNYGASNAKPVDFAGQIGYVNPWATFCAHTCTRTGPTGVGYLFFDALVNGNGKGWNPAAPGANWNTSVVNYFWEPNSVIQIGTGSGSYLSFRSEGASAATWYLLQTTIVKAIPALSVPLATLFWGPHLVTVGYKEVLRQVASALDKLGKVGTFGGNSILAYLGELVIHNSNPPQYYRQGISGTLSYWTDLLTGAVPFPSAATSAPAAVGAAAATTVTPAAVAATVAAPQTPAVSNVTTPAAAASVSTPASSAVVSTPAAKAAASTPAPRAAASTSAADTPAASTPAPTTTAPKHPVLDAVQKVTKQITSAISGAKAAKAGGTS